jgi:hypothetical protein
MSSSPLKIQHKDHKDHKDRNSDDDLETETETETEIESRHIDEFYAQWECFQEDFKLKMKISRAMYYIKNKMPSKTLKKHFPKCPESLARDILVHLFKTKFSEIHDSEYDFENFIQLFEIDDSIPNITEMKIIKLRKKNKEKFQRLEINQNKSLASSSSLSSFQSQPAPISKIPISLLSYIFTFLKPTTTLLGKCYRVNRYWLDAVSLSSSCIYWDYWNNLDHVGKLVPNWLFNLEYIHGIDQYDFSSYINILKTKPHLLNKIKFFSGCCNNIIPLLERYPDFFTSLKKLNLVLSKLERSESKFCFSKFEQTILNNFKNTVEDLYLTNWKYEDSTIVVPPYLKNFGIVYNNRNDNNYDNDNDNTNKDDIIIPKIQIGDCPNLKLLSIQGGCSELINLSGASNLEKVILRGSKLHFYDMSYYITKKISLTIHAQYIFLEHDLYIWISEIIKHMDINSFTFVNGATYKIIKAIIDKEEEKKRDNYNIKNILATKEYAIEKLTILCTPNLEVLAKYLFHNHQELKCLELLHCSNYINLKKYNKEKHEHDKPILLNLDLLKSYKKGKNSGFEIGPFLTKLIKNRNVKIYLSE